MTLMPIGACVHAERHQQVRKVFSSLSIPVMGISVLQDMVEDLNIRLPKSIPVATRCKPAD